MVFTCVQAAFRWLPMMSLPRGSTPCSRLRACNAPMDSVPSPPASPQAGFEPAASPVEQGRAKPAAPLRTFREGTECTDGLQDDGSTPRRKAIMERRPLAGCQFFKLRPCADASSNSPSPFPAKEAVLFSCRAVILQSIDSMRSKDAPGPPLRPANSALQASRRYPLRTHARSPASLQRIDLSKSCRAGRSRGQVLHFALPLLPREAASVVPQLVALAKNAGYLFRRSKGSSPVTFVWPDGGSRHPEAYNLDLWHVNRYD